MRKPIAIGNSKEGPSFYLSAGAKLMVIFFKGNRYPQFLSAAFTLSLHSLTAASGSPMTTVEGSSAPL
jgi:hypothetical protein